LTTSEGRRFGITVGLAFAALSLFAWWRGATTVRALLLLVAGLLVVAGIVVPRHLGPVQRAWMGMARGISRVTTPVVLGVMYFGVMTPMGVIRRTFGRSPLRRTPADHGAVKGGYWIERQAGERRSDMRRQF
jgi:hypothetical protein